MNRTYIHISLLYIHTYTRTCTRTRTTTRIHAHYIMPHHVPSALCPLPLVAGTTLFFLFLHLYCFIHIHIRGETKIPLCDRFVWFMASLVDVWTWFLWHSNLIPTLASHTPYPCNSFSSIYYGTTTS